MIFGAGLFVLGYGIGCLSITPLTKILAAVLSGEDWRAVLHDSSI